MEDVAYAIGISPGYLSRLETENRNVSLRLVGKLAKELHISQSDLVPADESSGGTISVMGYAAAGSDQVTFSEAQGPFDEVDAPSWATERTVAVQIRGTSLGKPFNNWLAFYDDRRDPPDESCFGELCICGLIDGRVMIKTLQKGSAKGRYHLESLTEPTLSDQRVAWAAIVKELRRR